MVYSTELVLEARVPHPWHRKAVSVSLTFRMGAIFGAGTGPVCLAVAQVESTVESKYTRARVLVYFSCV
jgi:hypothetical protein